MLKILLFAILFAVQSCFCFADTLILKDGKAIQADDVWEDGDLFMYSVDGATVGISKDKVTDVKVSRKQKRKGDAFQFDVWPFGTTVKEAFDIAQQYDLPLHKDGIISMDKNFNPTVKDHADDATHFYYHTTLLGYFAKVELFFTPVSKKLCSVRITWPNQQNEDSTLEEQISSMISGKYGKAKNAYNKTKQWVLSGGNQIVQDVSFDKIDLSYLQGKLIRTAEIESKQMKDQKAEMGMTKDMEKF